jgi:MOSC domain-containing protein
MRVLALWRYPVKSMQGEEIPEADVGDLGLMGDRQWAVVDTETGLALTGRREPALLFARARLQGPADVVIELPDGSTATSDDELTAWLGHPVELRRASPSAHGRFEIATDFEAEDTSEWFQWDGPEGTFHDSGRTRVSLISEGAMGGWAWRRFRGNVVVDGDETELVGSRVDVGSAELEVVKRIDRCVMTTRPQPDGIERDLDVLRTINRDRDGFLGVGALVLGAGSISVGDELTVR